MIYILPWTTNAKSTKKKKHFQGYYIQSRRNFKDSSKTSLKIQGLFKTVRALDHDILSDVKLLIVNRDFGLFFFFFFLKKALIYMVKDNCTQIVYF